jgi:hypothetical protein
VILLRTDICGRAGVRLLLGYGELITEKKLRGEIEKNPRQAITVKHDNVPSGETRVNVKIWRDSLSRAELYKTESSCDARGRWRLSLGG